MKFLIPAVLILVFVPVAFTQLITLVKSNKRSFEWVRLADTSYTEISFPNLQQNIDLAGMLFVPEGEEPFPAVVIIHGSGPSRRDSGWYLTLTKHLQDNGVLVLLPDKRGSESSGGDWRNASLEELATDTLAAIDFLLDQNEIEISHIGIIGMSQGGAIAPVVASESENLSFIVNVVGGTLPAHDSLYYEEIHNLREMGFLPGISDLLAYPTSWSLIYLRDRTFWQAIGNFDPLPFWDDVTIPALVLYGEDDTNVPTAESARLLEELNKPNLEVVVYPGSGHALEDPAGHGNSIFRKDALEKTVAFILGASQSKSQEAPK